MINIVKIGNNYNFYDHGHKTTMNKIDIIEALLKMFDHDDIDYNIIIDTNGEKTKNGTIRELFKNTIKKEKLW